ncbi:MAG: hypothetical protein LWW94_07310, partial [Candidatus Desulfofervidaceae bacterium]|nr:hypothetical protein [Candidatus Desulfofervidaceae bacterium]
LHSLRSLRPVPKKAQAAPFGLALDRPRPWQKRKLKGGREKEIFVFPSGLKKKIAPKRARSRLAAKPPAGLGLDRMSERRRYNYNWA